MKLFSLIRASVSQTIREQKLLTVLFSISILYLFLYSFTQIDLSLVLARSSLLQTVERAFQYIGYFNRPLSTVLFIILLLLLSTLYFMLIKKVQKGKISRTAIWTFILVMAGVLIFAYNAFSYDIFNYIFDAKIATHYYQNPYLHKALDYPGDPMLSFMHWTHRTYPYGPLWLFLSIPFSWLGHSYFLLTFFLFKAGIAASFVGSLYYIEKIMEKISPKRSVETLVIVAFHPLFIIENLISAHNDIVMMFFTLLSLYLLINKKQVLSGVSFICSIAIKFATVFLLPSIVFLGIAQRKKIPNVWNLFFLFSGCCLLVAVLYASHQSNFQPWYLVWPLSFFFLLPLSHYGKTSLIVSVFSIVSLLLYVPYLYNGDWNKAIPTSYFIILWSVILVYALGAGIISMIRNK